ncbi:MAG: pentapeptide repeat-containing protein [Planctomycetota bacterium]
MIFNSSQFRGQARFRRAVFHGTAGFDGCSFAGVVTFKNAVFHNDAKFRTVVFSGYCLLGEVLRQVRKQPFCQRRKFLGRAIPRACRLWRRIFVQPGASRL